MSADFFASESEKNGGRHFSGEGGFRRDAREAVYARRYES